MATFAGVVQANRLRVCIAVNDCFSAARLALSILCQAMGAGGANGCQGRTVVRERHEAKSLNAGNSAERDLEPRKSSFSGHRLPILLHRLQCGMLISKCNPRTAVQ